MSHGYEGSTTMTEERVSSVPAGTEFPSARWRATSGISVRFWGVRGSLACPQPELARYGGNTSCVEMRCGDRLLIFDAGTGLRALGSSLAGARRPVDADIFFSHFHIDHVYGLPFFAPIYEPDTRLRLWGGNLLPARRIAQAIGQMMSEPLFPIGLDAFKAGIELHDFRAGEVLRPHPGVVLRTAPLNHPGGATGYRLEYGSRSVAYITDTEHHAGSLDRNVLDLARGVDLMIYDCNYTEQEYPAHRDWGHSTWQQGVLLANAADAKLLALFHHDPDHDDAMLDRIGAEAKTQRSATTVAAEGMTLRF